jgi:hypothetical protein
VDVHAVLARLTVLPLVPYFTPLGEKKNWAQRSS